MRFVPMSEHSLVSALRGNTLQQAAKCIVVMVKIGKKTKRYVLAVVPGDRRAAPIAQEAA